MFYDYYYTCIIITTIIMIETYYNILQPHDKPSNSPVDLPPVCRAAPAPGAPRRAAPSRAGSAATCRAGVGRDVPRPTPTAWDDLVMANFGWIK